MKHLAIALIILAAGFIAFCKLATVIAFQI